MAPATPSIAETATPPRRGRKPKYLTAQDRVAGTRLRKQRQRERERDSGLIKWEILLPKDVLGSLAVTAAFIGSDPKALAAFLVKGALIPYRREMEALGARAGAVWLKAKPYMYYASYLEKPGSHFTVHGRTLTHDEWKPLSEEIATIRAGLIRHGWSKERIDRFIRRQAERASIKQSPLKPQ